MSFPFQNRELNVKKKKKIHIIQVMDEELLASSRMKCFYFVMMATESIEVDMRLLFR